MAADVNRLVEILPAAGIVDPANLTADDRKLIGQLSEAEVQTLNDIARRVYPSDPSMVKILPLGKGGTPRVCVPL